MAMATITNCYSVEEAIFLANRVVVMTPGPGRIESDNALDLPRPRDVASPEFNAIRRVLGAKLHSHHAKKAASRTAVAHDPSVAV